MIYTCIRALDKKEDWESINNLEKLFIDNDGDVYYIELEADYNTRIERNKTENRLLIKPSKRDIVKSESLFKDIEARHRLNSYPNEIKKENYIKINNTNIDPLTVAKTIKEKFKL